jgi:hypothetical protein
MSWNLASGMTVIDDEEATVGGTPILNEEEEELEVVCCRAVIDVPNLPMPGHCLKRKRKRNIGS